MSFAIETSKGRNYSFDGFPPGETPVELFDAGRWLECLHACMAGVMVNRLHIEDDGVLHELVHLALGVEICTHSSMGGLRNEICEIETLALSAIDAPDSKR